MKRTHKTLDYSTANYGEQFVYP